MIKIEMLRCFVQVARQGNLQDAAQQLGRTPSAVSMMLKQFEEHLGGRLFLSDRKNVLSPLGQFVFEQAQNELVHFDSTVSAVEAFAKNPEGIIRIASVPSAIFEFLVPTIKAFAQTFPGIRIDLRDMDSQSMLNAIINGQVELCVASMAQKSDLIHSQNLLQDNFGVVCHPDHPLAKMDGIPGFEDLANYPFVSNDLCAGMEDEQVQALVETSQLSARNTLSLMSIVQSGDWYTILPGKVVAINPEQLAFRKIRDWNVKRELSLCYRVEVLQIPYINAFIELLETTASEVA